MNLLLGLERLAGLTREVAIIETEAIGVPGFQGRALCVFFPADELAGDFTNWRAPNSIALAAMCRAAGFRHVETSISSSAPSGQPGHTFHDRIAGGWSRVIGRENRPSPGLGHQADPGHHPRLQVGADRLLAGGANHPSAV